MTKEERLLWNAFLKKYPVQFRRQYIIGNYIVDFYCHKEKQVIELDGSQHFDPNAQQKDTERTTYLESQGCYVLRFTNSQVIQEFRNVCEEIDRIVTERVDFFDRHQSHIPSPEGKVPRRGG